VLEIGAYHNIPDWPSGASKNLNVVYKTMSSVTRYLKQTPSNFFWSHGADIWTLDDIKAAFRGQIGSGYTGPEPLYDGSLILFDTEAHFADATYQLLYNSSNTYYADSYNTHIDMGKNIYIGVQGSDSKMLTMSLVKLQGTSGGSPRVGYGLTAMNLSDYALNVYDGDIDVDLFRAAV